MRVGISYSPSSLLSFYEVVPLQKHLFWVLCDMIRDMWPLSQATSMGYISYILLVEIAGEVSDDWKKPLQYNSSNIFLDASLVGSRYDTVRLTQDSFVSYQLTPPAETAETLELRKLEIDFVTYSKRGVLASVVELDGSDVTSWLTLTLSDGTMKLALGKVSWGYYLYGIVDRLHN